ncbi:MAG: proline racemase family protein [Rhizobiaceae bacterium]|nr:proline racemase family protein [Rhizobiaceae bacterium]
MRWDRTLQLVEAHAEGEIGRVVTGGQPKIPGKTLQEKFRYLLNEQDLRHSLCLEPRGAAAGSVILLFAPEDPENDAGIVILQPDQAHAMSGSNAICATTVLLETGIIEMQEGEILVRLETAAGLVVAKAQCEEGKCVSVTLSMPASFVEQLDCTIETGQWGRINADIAFGGVFYAIIDAERLGMKIEPAQARQLSDAGMALKEILNKQLSVTHPENPDIHGIAYVMFRQNEDDGTVRTATTMWPGRLDRSPCGTGNSANLATRVERGEISEGDVYFSRSTIDSQFKVRHAGTTMIGNKQAVLPEITGRGWIYGMHQIGFDPSDPFKSGFALTDTWGVDAGKIRP